MPLVFLKDDPVDFEMILQNCPETYEAEMLKAMLLLGDITEYDLEQMTGNEFLSYVQSIEMIIDIDTMI